MNNTRLDSLRGSIDEGWGVARNPIKILNHLDFLRRQENISSLLGLNNISTPTKQYQVNQDLLTQYWQRDITFDQFIMMLSQQRNRQGIAMDSNEIMNLLRAYITCRHLEFHPTDFCNLHCYNCSFGSEHSSVEASFSSHYLDRLAVFQPKSILVVGGGEPTLYRNGSVDFQELIELIMAYIPGIKLGLITNGTYYPSGDWPKYFSWLRISLDAATPEMYKKFRGIDLFDKVISNFIDYLDTPIPYIGIGFLFSHINVSEYTMVAQYIYDIVNRFRPEQISKVNIQFRPMRNDLPNTFFPDVVTEIDINNTVEQILELIKSRPEIKPFLREQTNIPAILGGNTHTPIGFPRCYYTEIFRLIRASGDVYPCCMRALWPELNLGNIISDPLEAIAARAMYIATKAHLNCNSIDCRKCYDNHLLYSGFIGKTAPSTLPEILADPMF